MNFGTELSQFIRIFLITLAILKQVEKDNRMQCYISAIMCILYTPLHSPSLHWLVALGVLRRQSRYLSDFIAFLFIPQGALCFKIFSFSLSLFLYKHVIVYLLRFVSDCSVLKAPIHGSLSSSLKAHDTYVSVSCETNFTLVGKSNLRCVSGSWSETVGTCERGIQWIFKEFKESSDFFVGDRCGVVLHSC